jgi:hypothetical protein
MMGQECNGLVLALRSGKVRSCFTSMRSRAFVTLKSRICTMVEQEMQDCQMAPKSGPMKGREPIAAAAVHVGAMGDEQADQLQNDFFPVAGIGNIGCCNSTP